MDQRTLLAISIPILILLIVSLTFIGWSMRNTTTTLTIEQTKTVVVPTTVTKTVTYTYTTYSATPVQSITTHTSAPSSITTTHEINMTSKLEQIINEIERLRQSYNALLGYVYAPIPEVETGAVRYTMPTVTVAVTQLVSKTASIRVSGTNVQVKGVDELDIVKTDGKKIYFAYSNKLYIIDVEKRRVDTTIEFSKNTRVQGLMLYKSRLLVVLKPMIFRIMVYPPPEKTSVETTHILVYDVSEKPRILANISLTGYVLNARMLNGTIYLVATYRSLKPLPRIADKIIDPSKVIVLSKDPESVYTILFAYDMDSLRYDYRVFLTYAGSYIYLSSDGNLYIVAPSSRFSIIITLIEKALPRLPKDLVEKLKPYIEKGDVAKALEIFREYLTTCPEGDFRYIVKLMQEVGKDLTTKTVIYLFKVRGLDVEFVSKNDVAGVVGDQFAIEQMDKYFIVTTTVQSFKVYIGRFIVPYKPAPISRGITIIVSHRTATRTYTYSIITPTTTVTPKPRVWISVYPATTLWNNVYVLELPNLNIVAKIERIAEGERVYAARLIGKMLFFVTFRRIDPLFAVDLSDPKNPKIIGWLTMPGYSEYLHPIAKGYLVGVGVENGGVKISLINISDPKAMKELAKIVIRPGWSTVFHDYHAFLHDAEYHYIAIPIKSFWMDALTIVRYNVSEGILYDPIFVEHKGVIRALYIGDKLYSLGYKSVKVVDLNTYRVIEEIPLP